MSNNGQGNERWRQNARLAIYVMAGFYLLTMAVNMFKVIPTSTGTNRIIMIVFSVLFVIIGIAMMGFGLTATYRNAKKIQDEWKEAEEQSTEEIEEVEEIEDTDEIS